MLLAKTPDFTQPLPNSPLFAPTKVRSPPHSAPRPEHEPGPRPIVRFLVPGTHGPAYMYGTGPDGTRGTVTPVPAHVHEGEGPGSSTGATYGARGHGPGRLGLGPVRGPERPCAGPGADRAEPLFRAQARAVLGRCCPLYVRLTG